MIETCLAELYSALPKAEVLRIQKTLKVIIGRELDPERLRRALNEAYSRLGSPFEVLERRGLLPAFDRLLDHFGVLSTAQLDADEQESLRQNPYTVWPDESRCVLCGEALELLARESGFRKRNYLYGELTRLPVKERRAWFQWLGLECSVRSEKDRGHQIYLHLAEERRRHSGSSTRADQALQSTKLPEYLDEVFADDPQKTPVAWFYRDILPLYQSLADAEKQLKMLRPGAKGYRARNAQLALIELFKYGHVIARATYPEFGDATRYRLLWTRESVATASDRPQEQERQLSKKLPTRREPTARQEVLF